jgi:hypothetical protein
MTIRRYRTQEVAGSSPASSIHKVPASGIILSDLANPHPQLIYLRATKLFPRTPLPKARTPFCGFESAMNMGLEVALLKGSCSCSEAAGPAQDWSSKPVRRRSPTLGRFDSCAAPFKARPLGVM